MPLVCIIESINLLFLGDIWIIFKAADVRDTPEKEETNPHKPDKTHLRHSATAATAAADDSQLE